MISRAIVYAWMWAKGTAWTIFAFAILTQELWNLAAQWRDII